ncbi:hypothetical protein FQV27_03280 [Paracoccus aurantiacus]|uniref:Uncharacterized protein n=1 Tax=Paracoccus aurantiacus TaxID=2599412 RepID=A0A5C6SAS2_9RHOB|nr:DUF5996 family protein [Paracoccus aurantiacus]TXB70883.1 hypothetical protein FQV27_03280 [Paracoccus aurantiacus]
MNGTLYTSENWPPLSYEDFAPTQRLLHMILQVMGKLKLAEPFHAQWAEVILELSARGLTTGPIPYAQGVYEVRLDCIAHRLHWDSSTGETGEITLGPTSVAAVTTELLSQLNNAGIPARIDMMPQEVPDKTPFDKDKTERPYDRALVNAWWRILLSVQRVLFRFQGRFAGKTQPIGLMWGTMDIRLPLYSGRPAKPAPDAGFIRRNAMNAELMEMGWWSGDPSHAQPAFYAFTYPEPKGIGQEKIAPDAAGWSAKMDEFVLDYDALRRLPDPDAALMSFWETTYDAGARTGNWPKELLGSGKPS